MINESLLFTNPVFNSGNINLTVRKGTKWHNKIGEVRIGDTNNPAFRRKGVIFRTEETTLAEVAKTPNRLLDEHDPKCREIEGLRRELIDVYGEITDSDPITLVYFKIS